MKRIVKYSFLIINSFLLLLAVSCSKSVFENDDNNSSSDVQVDRYTVTFDSNGGSSVESQMIVKGGHATKPSDPIKEDYTFDDWYYNGVRWNFIENSITEDIVLYAEWNYSMPKTITTVEKGFISYAPGTVVNEKYVGLNINDYQDTTAYLDALKTRGVAKPINSNSIVCYATEREGYMEYMNNYFYLNQLGLKVDIAASIDVFVRISLQDHWILEKKIGGNTYDPMYINGKSLKNNPFYINNNNTDWYYDSNTNYLYYKHVVDSSLVTSNTDIYGNYIHSVLYNVNSSYFYEFNQDDTITNGHQELLVDLQFAYDIVQANRAFAIWGVDPLTIGD